jgi:hypothetical protein
LQFGAFNLLFPVYPGQGSGDMATIDEQILRTTKEIVVKFIESGRISPSSFHETFKDIYRTVEKTTKGSMKAAGQPDKRE